MTFSTHFNGPLCDELSQTFRQILMHRSMRGFNEIRKFFPMTSRRVIITDIFYIVQPQNRYSQELIGRSNKPHTLFNLLSAE